MPRQRFGSGISDWLFRIIDNPDPQEASEEIELVNQVNLEFYDSESLGSEIDDILIWSEEEEDYIPVSNFELFMKGVIPELLGPDHDSPTVELFVSSGNGPRLLMVPFEILDDLFQILEEIEDNVSNLDLESAESDIEDLEAQIDDLDTEMDAINSRVSSTSGEVGNLTTTPRRNTVVFHGRGQEQSIPHSTWTDLIWADVTVNEEVWNGLDPTDIVIQVPGYYQIDYRVGYGGFTGGTYRDAALAVDAIHPSGSRTAHHVHSTMTIHPITSQPYALPLNAGNVITVQAIQDSGSTGHTTGVAAFLSEIIVTYLEPLED